MKRYVYIVDTDDARNTLVRGPIRDLLKEWGIPAMRSAIHHGWHVRADRMPDLVARLEFAGYVVRRAKR